MLDAGVPTARATRHTDPVDAKRAAHALGAPVVVKASGLAAGKGVVVAQTLADAERAIDDMLVGNVFGDAGAEVLVEEFMEGEELSAFYLTDGHAAWPLVPLQDHKRLLAGDQGPNTGGMGAYGPVTVDDAALGAGARAHAGGGSDASGDPSSRDASLVAMLATATIVYPTLAALRDAGRPFTGLLYVGLMLTADGPKVVEFNCRFGDPETQALMLLLDVGGYPLGMLMTWIAHGGRLPGLGQAPLSQMEGTLVQRTRFVGTPPEHEQVFPAAVTTVLAAAGYPEKPRTGDPITLPDTLPEGVEIFHAGTALDAEGRLVTAGGRVLAVTAVADTFDEAQARSRAVAEQVEFAGKQYRADIGWREAARRSGR
jgi:phosphoribosylamine--glycine ligase